MATDSSDEVVPSSAEARATEECKPPERARLTDFFPPELVRLIESQELRDLGVHPIFATAKAPACGYAATSFASPWSAVARIGCWHNGVEHLGSAFLITANVLLTAAHNLMPTGTTTMVTKVTLTFPGQTVATTVLQANLRVSAYWPQGWPQGRDYGIIILPGAPGIPFIPPRVMDNAAARALFLQNTIANLAGYPSTGNKLFTNQGYFTLFADNNSNNLLCYQFNTCQGESGGPIFINYPNANGNYAAVAVQADLVYTQESCGSMTDAIMCGELFGWLNGQIAFA